MNAPIYVGCGTKSFGRKIRCGTAVSAVKTDGTSVPQAMILSAYSPRVWLSFSLATLATTSPSYQSHP